MTGEDEGKARNLGLTGCFTVSSPTPHRPCRRIRFLRSDEAKFLFLLHLDLFKRVKTNFPSLTLATRQTNYERLHITSRKRVSKGVDGKRQLVRSTLLLNIMSLNFKFKITKLSIYGAFKIFINWTCFIHFSTLSFSHRRKVENQIFFRLPPALYQSQQSFDWNFFSGQT